MEHNLFMYQDVLNAFFDDFMALPAEQLFGNVYQGLMPAVERHDWLFAFTH